MLTSFPIYGKWGIGQSSPNAGTAIAALIPPYDGPPNAAPILYAVGPSSVPNWWNFGGYGGCLTTITSMLFTEGSTVHTVYVLRPKNWTTVASAATAGQQVINISADPGVYTTNYRYPLPGVTPSAGLYAYPGRVANNVIAGSDYVVYQLTDGTWVVDTVSSVATLAITMTTNVPTGGVAAGAPFFWFGVGGDSDPATGLADPSVKPTATTNKIQQLDDKIAGGIAALHPGDPMIIFSANASNAGILDFACGYYGPF